MTYNEAAVIIVNKHLRENNDSGNDNNFSNENQSHNGEYSVTDSHSNLNTTNGKARNHSPSRKRQRNQEQRSKKEDNLRRRIYDAWNVLKAADIIVDHDDKNYWINQVVLQSLVSYSSDSNSDDDLADILSQKSPIKSKRKKLQDSNEKLKAIAECDIINGAK